MTHPFRTNAAESIRGEIMGAHKFNSTMPGGLTPICESCGIVLCWDISQEEYLEQKAFWDNWECKYCNPNYVQQWQRIELMKRRLSEAQL